MLNTINHYLEAGDLNNALSFATKQLQSQPNNDQLWHLTASIYDQMKVIDKAYFCLDSAIKLKPQNSLYLAYQAKLLINPQALINISSLSLEMALDIANGLDINGISDEKSLHCIASVYRHLNYFDEALTWYKKAVTISPDQSHLQNDLGVMHQLYNNNDSAITHLNRALALNPNDHMAYWQLAQLKHSDYQEFINRIKNCLTTTTGSDTEAKIYLHFSLARLYEQQAQYQQAFEHLAIANQTCAKAYPYDLDSEKQRFEQLKSIDLRNCNNPISKSDKSPIFIIGLPRTGTTLVEQLLCRSPLVASAGELLHFPLLFNAAEQQLINTTASDDHSLEQLNFSLLGQTYLQSCSIYSGDSQYFIDKYPFNFMFVGAIAKAIPNAKFIQLQRNPMDSCFSNFKHLFRLGSARQSYSLQHLGEYFLEYQQLCDHWQQCLPNRYYRVDYDQLTINPETQAKQLYQFLELDWQENYLNLTDTNHAVATPSAAQVKQGIYQSSSQKWKNYQEELGELVDFFETNNININ